MQRCGILSTLACVAICWLGLRAAFVQQSASFHPEVRTPKLRAGHSGIATSPRVGESLPTTSALACAAIAALVARSAASCVARRAKATKKKGVRIVEGKEIPWNLFSPKAPYKAKFVKNDVQPQTLTQKTGDGNWETCHITIDHGGNVPYVEGQSIGVIAPGPDKNGATPAKIRLYSIASSALGDDEEGKTVSLCVKRNVVLDADFANRQVGEDKPDKAGTAFPDRKVYRGVASNFICDSNPGDEIMISGPTGAEMLLPADPTANIIMLATGTGIAPMRSYLRLLFNDKAGASPDGGRTFKGLAWLFLGVPHSASILYDEEHQEYKKNFPDNFRYDYAVSREQKNAAGEKMYIQTKMGEYTEELWDLLQKTNTHVYLCGLKGMEKGIEQGFSPIAAKHGVEWADFVKKMKHEKRYHVEVY